ncbi:hypothetical protein [Thomasclavelia cocleata]|uniref:hypothetical protein n=1 Tax=Thomasclavelia cocleata TaxID=69824 RepID=UPI00272AF3AC|nr:hypothetical protein [Thomasclavelia cocleata]
MAKHIDLTNKFSKEKPSITIGNLTLTVNDEKSNVLMMNSLIKSGKMTEFEIIDKSLEMLLGETGYKKVEKLKLRLSDYKTLYFAIMAVVNDEELEDVEKRFQKQQ